MSDSRSDKLQKAKSRLKEFQTKRSIPSLTSSTTSSPQLLTSSIASNHVNRSSIINDDLVYLSNLNNSLSVENTFLLKRIKEIDIGNSSFENMLAARICFLSRSRKDR